HVRPAAADARRPRTFRRGTVAGRGGSNLRPGPDRASRVRTAPKAVPWLVGLIITAAYWFTSSTSFANPAVTLARGLTSTFAGIAIGDVPSFVVAQLAGAAIAAATAAVLAQGTSAVATDAEADRVGRSTSHGM